MIKNIYILEDRISKTYSDPIVDLNDAKIVRDLKHLINTNKDSELSINANDKVLWLIGKVDLINGELVLGEKTHIIDLKNLLEPINN